MVSYLWTFSRYEKEGKHKCVPKHREEMEFIRSMIYGK